MRHRPNINKSGFTLVELLMVILIIAVLAAAISPAMPGIMGAGAANQNISQLSGILDQAREYAVAQNTYVWVTFTPVTASPAGYNQVSVAVVASTDGTDPAVTNSTPWTSNTYGAVPGPGLTLINKVVTMKQLSIKDAGSLTPSTLLQAADSTNKVPTYSNGFFTIQTPGTGTTATYTQAIEFTPSGQARNATSPIDFVDVDVQPQRGTVDDPHSFAVLRVNGLTGETTVYRP